MRVKLPFSDCYPYVTVVAMTPKGNCTMTVNRRFFSTVEIDLPDGVAEEEVNVYSCFLDASQRIPRGCAPALIQAATRQPEPVTVDPAQTNPATPDPAQAAAPTDATPTDPTQTPADATQAPDTSADATVQADPTQVPDAAPADPAPAPAIQPPPATEANTPSSES